MVIEKTKSDLERWPQKVELGINGRPLDYMKRVLFICSRNQLRSPTAEQVFSKWPGIEVASAGLDRSSLEPVTPELLEWADLIFVMERAHRTKVAKKFRSSLKHQRIVCLNIPDEYGYMDQRLVQLLEKIIPPHLGS